MTAQVDISPEAVERMTAFLERWYQHRPDEGFRIVIAMLNALSSSATASEKDAARWRHARQFLAVEDIERWGGEDWHGHCASEDESTKADSAIDTAMESAHV